VEGEAETFADGRIPKLRLRRCRHVFWSSEITVKIFVVVLSSFFGFF